MDHGTQLDDICIEGGLHWNELESFPGNQTTSNQLKRNQSDGTDFQSSNQVSDWVLVLGVGVGEPRFFQRVLLFRRIDSSGSFHF